MTVSASSLHRAAACPASTILPQVRTESAQARRGNVIHAFLQRCAEIGREAALEVVPEDMTEVCDAIDITQLPVFPTANSKAELAMAFDLATGRARILGESINRLYEVAPTEVPGTSDVVIPCVEQDLAVVLDYKSGHAVLPPPEQNWQMRLLGLCAARCFMVSRVQIVLVQVTPGYRPKTTSAMMEALDLDTFESELQEVYRKLVNARRKHDQGEELRVTIGDHCRYCPAMSHCPGMRALIGQFTANGASAVSIATPQHAAEAWLRVRALKQIVETAEEAIKNYATATPLDLGNGKALGPVEVSNESLDGGVTLAVLRQMIGPEAADQAVEFKATKTAVRAAIAPVAKRRGVAIAQLERDVYAELKRRQGIRRSHGISVKEHVIKAEQVRS